MRWITIKRHTVEKRSDSREKKHKAVNTTATVGLLSYGLGAVSALV